MFKKLCVLVLTIGTSYAMEDITNTPTGDNDNIKQTTENTQTADDNKDKVNEVTDDLSILNIDKTVEQMDNIKVEENKTNDKKEAKDKSSINENIFFYKPDDIANVNNTNKIKDKKQNKNTNQKRINKNSTNIGANENSNNFISTKNRENKDSVNINTYNKEEQNYNPNRINEEPINTKKDNYYKNSTMFGILDDKKGVNLSAEDYLNTAVLYSGADDIKELMSCFSSDEQFLDAKKYSDSWIKIDVQNKFAQSCQEFLRKIIISHKITEQMVSNFCNSDAFYDCAKMDIEPMNILQDVYKSNVKMDYMSETDMEFLGCQMRYLLSLIPVHTRKIKQHWYKINALQEQLHISETEASQIYWDSYWSNYFSSNNR